MNNQSLVVNYEFWENNLRKVLRVKSGQTVNMETFSMFDKPGQGGEVEVKAVVEEGGTLNLKGIIMIKKGAEGTEAFLRQSVLLLGKNAKAVAIPELEIECDDVKASHAATVGQIDPEQVFYLQQRGLSSNQAVELIVKAFLK